MYTGEGRFLFAQWTIELQYGGLEAELTARGSVMVWDAYHFTVNRTELTFLILTIINLQHSSIALFHYSQWNANETLPLPALNPIDHTWDMFRLIFES